MAVNEAYTTKASVCCHGAETKNMKNGHSRESYKNGNYRNYPYEIHGIRICQRCGRTWHRDKVGAINIYDVYMALLNNEERPFRYTRACYEN